MEGAVGWEGNGYGRDANKTEIESDDDDILALMIKIRPKLK